MQFRLLFLKSRPVLIASVAAVVALIFATAPLLYADQGKPSRPAAHSASAVPATQDMGTSKQANALSGASTQAVMNQFRFYSGNINAVANGVGLRNLGYGTIRLRGQFISPDTAEVASWLEFSFICAGACPPTQTVNFNGIDVVGSSIGQSSNPCWSGGNIGTYMADVTGLLNGGINDDYNVANVPSGDIDGHDPWTGTVTPPLAEGATLISVVSDPSYPLANVYIHTGPNTFFGQLVTDHPLSPVATGNTRKFTSIGEDGQVGGSVFADPSTSGETESIGTSSSQTFISGSNSSFNRDSNWNGTDGGPLNQLHDTHTIGFGGLIPSGSNSYRTVINAPSDCLTPDVDVLQTF